MGEEKSREERRRQTTTNRGEPVERTRGGLLPMHGSPFISALTLPCPSLSYARRLFQEPFQEHDGLRVDPKLPCYFLFG